MSLRGGLGGSSLGGGLGGGLGLQQFDTGLARPQRTLLREHVEAALAPLLKANGLYLHKIGNLPRPLRGRDDEELGLLVSAVNAQTPAVLVALGSQTPEAIGMSADEEEGTLELAIYVISSNARSFVEGRLQPDAAALASAQADPGIEAMLEHVAQIVLGQDLNLATASEIRGKSEDEVYTFAEYTVWEQTYVVKLTRDINANRAITQVLTEVRVSGLPDGFTDPDEPFTDTRTELEVPTP